MLNDFRGRSVLVTGGTRGIGLATGLAFGRAGAVCTLTHRWGSADEGAIREAFRAAGAPEPFIEEADAANAEDTAQLIGAMRARHDAVDVFVSGVALAPIVRGLDDYTLHGLAKAIEYSAWPTFAYAQKIREVFGRYPRYVVGLSSMGPDAFFPGYDLAAAAKSVLETLCRYFDHRLSREDVRVNVLRAGFVRTDALRATFGDEVEPFLARHGVAHPFVEPDEVGRAVLGLCSGLMDGVRGQVLIVDHGAAFADNLMRMYAEHRAARGGQGTEDP